MGVIADRPTHDVVDRAPSFGAVASNFNATDYRDVLLGASAGGGLGWIVGGGARAKVCMRTPTAVTMGGLGLAFGVMYATQSSAARLMGFRPNA